MQAQKSKVTSVYPHGEAAGAGSIAEDWSHLSRMGRRAPGQGMPALLQTAGPHPHHSCPGILTPHRKSIAKSETITAISFTLPLLYAEPGKIRPFML